MCSAYSSITGGRDFYFKILRDDFRTKRIGLWDRRCWIFMGFLEFELLLPLNRESKLVLKASMISVLCAHMCIHIYIYLHDFIRKYL